MVEQPRAAREWNGLSVFVEEVVGSVGVVVDIVLGHTATLVAHTLRQVDRLVDDAVADAATIAREAEELLDATLESWIGAERFDESESD